MIQTDGCQDKAALGLVAVRCTLPVVVVVVGEEQRLEEQRTRAQRERGGVGAACNCQRSCLVTLLPGNTLHSE